MAHVSFGDEDVFMYYDYERALVRYEGATRKFFCRFTDGAKEYEIDGRAKLLNDVVAFGRVVSRKEYLSFLK